MVEHTHGHCAWKFRFFAALGSSMSAIEMEIGAKLGYIERLYPNDRVGEVTVTPIAPGATVLGQRMAPSELEVRRLWPDGRFRLFSEPCIRAQSCRFKLKDELRLRGVAAFVAHEDIEPSLEWRGEIELGLRSMHALAALVTPEFHASHWTDQEIGWALGRGVLVVPVCLGVDPYGFAGKYQGVPGTLDRPAELAESIVKALLANPPDPRRNATFAGQRVCRGVIFPDGDCTVWVGGGN